MTKSRIGRRGFIAGAAAGTATLATPALSQNRRQLNMVMSWPHNFPGLASIAYNFRDIVQQLSDNEITVRVHAAGELVAAFEVFDAVSSGAADVYHGPPIFLVQKWPAATFFGLVPFGLTAHEHVGWMYHGGGQALQHAEYRQRFGIVPFTAGQTGVQMAGWFNREIRSLDDFRGVRMRILGTAGEVMRRAGASPVTIPPQEIFQALQGRTIDATELCCAWLDAGNGFQRVAKNYYTPGWQEPNSAGEIGINARLFDGLSNRHKAIVERAAQAANSINMGEWPRFNSEFMRTLIREHQVVVRTYPDDVVLALARASKDVVEELGTRDESSRRIWASWKPYRDMVSEYSVQVELPMLQARRIALANNL